MIKKTKLGKKNMNEQGILIEKTPVLEKPILIAGFEGWGNALNVAKGLIEYLIHKLDGDPFAHIDPDLYYQYTESRPIVSIEDGLLKELSPPGGTFHAVRTDPGSPDLVLLKAVEPDLRWFHFARETIALCKRLNVETIITVGSMFDAVLHSDRLISGTGSSVPFVTVLEELNVKTISYDGPCAINSAIQIEGRKNGFDCIGLWAHCSYYLEGIAHYGMIAALVRLLGGMCGFEPDTDDLEANWDELNEEIKNLIAEDEDIRDTIKEIRKERVSGLNKSKHEAKGKKVIDLKDYRP